ncbi:CRISPR-associated autoregulator DevR family [Leptospira kirschneri str. 200803703]|uniref:CRISPR-associated autoregulator DevR family n=1 Tax=Leptospira kirschneri str. 200802841 TaxID=1193047 RepID=A0A828Y9I8_9LEPT|nr:DevR family CRISPR-associated autoregulator [Leptospira kirschneri]EKO52617.1 CRISPR-associated autoregulator DevR family [Leptospira kirschneri str. 200802841]EMO68725.1 CRISPR-associated autoregulator DevR family [Leptospira kirschneri str. 200803703]EMO74253.1 CRISPR-associated autoregulator DevR family [Leptospira kirschneri str. 200801925]
MSKHLFGQVITHDGIAANNRGETEGNITTLQKILWKGEIHTTLSAEAIRFATRYFWQLNGEDVNRYYKWNGEQYSHEWKDANWSGWLKDPRETFIDDDIFGFMEAKAGQQEGEDEIESKNKEKEKKKSKGKSIVRKGVLEFSRALSLIPYAGDITFNAKSGEKNSNSVYGTEVHATRYQYGFTITPESLEIKDRVYKILKAISNLNQVAGNQSRFLYDFSPESIILRWTDDFAPRILYSFEESENILSIPSIVEKVNSGDLEGETLIIAGPITKLPEVTKLKEKKVTLFDGIKQGFLELEQRIKKDLK